MSADKHLFLFAGTYPTADEAHLDYEVFKALHAEGVVGILFPPSIIGSAAVLGVTGGLMGHLWKGMSRADGKELGDLVDEGQAALVIVGESKLEQYLDRALSRATRRMAKEVESEAAAFSDTLADASAH